MSLRRVVTFIAALVLQLTFATVARAADYSVVDLGDWAPSARLDNRGNVVSTLPSTTGSVADERVYLRSRDGSITDVFTGGSSSAINDRDQVVVWYADPQHDYERQVLLWERGQVTATIHVPSDGYDVSASAINIWGQILCTYWASAGPGTRSFVWTNGQVTYLAGDDVNARDINDLGVVAGFNRKSHSDSAQARIWAWGRTIDLGTLGGDWSSATGINNALQVIGNSNLTVGGPMHAFLWDAGHMVDLGAPGADSYAEDINDLGQVVGEQSPVGPVLWDHGRAIVLAQAASPGGDWTLNQSLSINDRGQILVSGSRWDGEHWLSHLFLLSPAR